MHYSKENVPRHFNTFQFSAPDNPHSNDTCDFLPSLSSKLSTLTLVVPDNNAPRTSPSPYRLKVPKIRSFHPVSPSRLSDLSCGSELKELTLNQPLVELEDNPFKRDEFSDFHGKSDNKTSGGTRRTNKIETHDYLEHEEVEKHRPFTATGLVVNGCGAIDDRRRDSASVLSALQKTVNSKRTFSGLVEDLHDRFRTNRISSYSKNRSNSYYGSLVCRLKELNIPRPVPLSVQPPGQLQKSVDGETLSMVSGSTSATAAPTVGTLNQVSTSRTTTQLSRQSSAQYSLRQLQSKRKIRKSVTTGGSTATPSRLRKHQSGSRQASCSLSETVFRNQIMPLLTAQIEISPSCEALAYDEQCSIWAAVDVHGLLAKSEQELPACHFCVDVILIIDNSRHSSQPWLQTVSSLVSTVVNSLTCPGDRIAILRTACCGDAVDKAGSGSCQIFDLASPNSKIINLNCQWMLKRQSMFTATQTHSCGHFVAAANNLYRRLKDYPALQQDECNVIIFSSNPAFYLKTATLFNPFAIHVVLPPGTVMSEYRNHYNGWAITTNDAEIAQLIMNNVSTAMDDGLVGKIHDLISHARLCCSPGRITDCQIRYRGLSGCTIEHVYGDTTLETLRAGQTWTNFVKIRVPSARRYHDTDDEDLIGDGDDTPNKKIKTMDRQFHRLESMLGELSQNVLEVEVSFKHSLLFSQSCMSIREVCRIRRPDLESIWTPKRRYTEQRADARNNQSISVHERLIFFLCNSVSPCEALEVINQGKITGLSEAALGRIRLLRMELEYQDRVMRCQSSEDHRQVTNSIMGQGKFEDVNTATIVKVNNTDCEPGTPCPVTRVAIDPLNLTYRNKRKHEANEMLTQSTEDQSVCTNYRIASSPTNMSIIKDSQATPLSVNGEDEVVGSRTSDATKRSWSTTAKRESLKRGLLLKRNETISRTASMRKKFAGGLARMMLIPSSSLSHRKSSAEDELNCANVAGGNGRESSRSRKALSLVEMLSESHNLKRSKSFYKRNFVS